jgi:hypothetical protein
MTQLSVSVDQEASNRGKEYLAEVVMIYGGAVIRT